MINYLIPTTHSKEYKIKQTANLYVMYRIKDNLSLVWDKSHERFIRQVEQFFKFKDIEFE